MLRPHAGAHVLAASPGPAWLRRLMHDSSCTQVSRGAALLLITHGLRSRCRSAAITVELCFLITKLSLMHIIVGLCGYTNYRTASVPD